MSGPNLENWAIDGFMDIINVGLLFWVWALSFGSYWAGVKWSFYPMHGLRIMVRDPIANWVY